MGTLNQPGTPSLPGEALGKVAVMCHVAHSKGCTPVDLDDRLVDNLVTLQLSAPKPIRAPWYRKGPHTEPSGQRSDWRHTRQVSKVDMRLSKGARASLPVKYHSLF